MARDVPPDPSRCRPRQQKCPRCGGWIYNEPALENALYVACINCGWEEECTKDGSEPGPPLWLGIDVSPKGIGRST